MQCAFPVHSARPFQWWCISDAFCICIDYAILTHFDAFYDLHRCAFYMHLYALPLSHICSTFCSPGLMAVKPTANAKSMPSIWLLSWWRATGRSRKTTRTRRKNRLCILLHFCVFLRISAQPRRDDYRFHDRVGKGTVQGNCTDASLMIHYMTPEMWNSVDACGCLACGTGVCPRCQLADIV